MTRSAAVAQAAREPYPQRQRDEALADLVGHLRHLGVQVGAQQPQEKPAATPTSGSMHVPTRQTANPTNSAPSSGESRTSSKPTAESNRPGK